MTASNIQITQGSGTRLATNSYTEGAVTVHDEKAILGEQYLPTYFHGPATSGSVSVATINSHVFQIMAGSSLKVRIRRIEVYQVGLATTAAFCAWLIIRLTTAGTGGTNNGQGMPLDPSDTASGSTMMTLPTAHGTESAVLWMGSSYFLQTAGASATPPNPMLVIDFDRPRMKPLIIPAGTANGIVLKNQTAIAGASIYFTVWFDESSF